MSDAPNILIIRLKSIGDVVFALPAVNFVRDSFPKSRITFLTGEENRPVASGFAAVDEIFTLDREALRRMELRAIYSESIGLVWRLRRAKFDLVVDLQGFGETALLTWLTRAPRRWGRIYRRNRRWAYTSGLDWNTNLHPADWNLSLLRDCGLTGVETVRNEFRLPESATAAACGIFARHGLDPAKRTLFIQPFTSSLGKNWPLEKYFSLASHWKARGLQVVFGGGPGDRAALEPARSAGYLVSAGVPLLTTAGLMKLSTVVVGSDTGLLHLANAMGQRVVMLIQSVRPGATFPYRHAEWAVTPGGGQLVSDIALKDVLAATSQALAECRSAPCAP
jgi:ADP-heptose:LPS heptosyltransferase